MIYYKEKGNIVFFYKPKNCIEQKIIENNDYTGFFNNKNDYEDYLSRHFIYTNNINDLELEVKNTYHYIKNYYHCKQNKYICIFRNKNLYIFDYISFKRSFFVKNLATFILI